MLANVEARIAVTNGHLSMAAWGANHLPNGWASFVKNLRVADGAGKVVNYESKPNGAWQLSNIPDGSVRLSYQVDLSFTKTKWNSGNEQAGVYLDGAVFVVTKALFIVSDDSSDYRVDFNLPADWKISTPWQTNGADGRSFVVKDKNDLINNSVVIGKHTEYVFKEEEYEKRKNDAAYFDWRGLNPALLSEIVRRAHAAGLRVSTHVETATDFHNALVAGTDEINHTPGFRPEKGDWKKYDAARFKISERDARLAARNRVTVVTTLVSAIDQALQKKEGEPLDAIRELLVHNLQLLNKHGVHLAIGSDSYRQTSLVEALNLQKLGAFDNRTLLKLWCENTAAAIFPNRKIGRLTKGYEASFLVLSGDPIQDFTNVQKIEMRVKQGEILSLQK